MWKVSNIQSGERVRGGFTDEEEAKSWVERRRDLILEDYEVLEMDEEEEEDYLENPDDDELDLYAGEEVANYDEEGTEKMPAGDSDGGFDGFEEGELSVVSMDDDDDDDDDD